MFYDSSYLLFFLPAIVLAGLAQIWISSSYSKNSKIFPKNEITGQEAGRKIVEGEGYPVEIKVQGGKLSDHFDPKNNVVNLSSASMNSSIADIAVTAHEFGHVDQKFSKSLLFNLRMGLVPVVNIGSRVGYVLIILGLILNALQLSEIGLLLFSTTAIFALITVPIEIDATKRGLSFIKKYNLIEEDKMSGAKSVLNAAAMTYVASLVTSLLNVLYFASRIRQRN